VVKLFELFQETRIYAFASIIPHRVAGRFVVGRVELELGEPMPWRADPYPVTSHISHVSRSSFSSVTRIDGGRYGTATATLVGFDLETQKSRPLDDDEREALTAAIAPA
jgi:acyl-CoA thioesterase FadM